MESTSSNDASRPITRSGSGLGLGSVRYVDLDTLLRNSDIITLHCPLLPSTYHLIDKKAVQKMKPGTMLGGQLGAIGLDVYEDESDIFFIDHTMFSPRTRMKMKLHNRKLHTLLAYPQVLVTPHLAFLTEEALRNIADATVENVLRWMEWTRMHMHVQGSADVTETKDNALRSSPESLSRSFDLGPNEVRPVIPMQQ